MAEKMTDMAEKVSEGSTQKWSELKEEAVRMLVPGVTEEHVTDLYNQWARNGYDEIFRLEVGPKYGALKVLEKAMKELFPPDSRAQAVVMDVGAGTGLSGKVMLDLGFTTVDGLDPAADMLRVAQEKKIYRNTYLCPLTADPLDIPADSYDAITLAGVVVHGHLPSAAFEEMARLVKPGGYIVNCMRAAFLQEIPDYFQNWEPLVARLEKEGKWKVVKMETYPNHFIGKDGLLMVFQVC